MNERVFFQSSAPLADPYRLGGSLKGWQDEIARPAIGNSRLLFALSAAFAGPLLHPLATEGGGFHFRGGSSTGKTTALQVAGSVWGGGGIGGFVKSWRATSNGLEGVAALHCDTLLCLDEIGQVAAREVGEVAYMLANGQGKIRAGRTGEARRSAEWRVLFLSSGEISLAQKMAEDGRQHRAMAGQEVRIVDIVADAGRGMGLFEDLHSFKTADAFARHLKAATAKHHGHAAIAFLEELVPKVKVYRERAAAFVKGFHEAHCPPGADGQVSRVLARFALVTAAGELATEFGVLPWQAGDASHGAAVCFEAWMRGRGGSGAAEDREAVALVRRFIEAHGSSRFEPMGALAPKDGQGNPLETRIINRVGFVRLADGAEGAREYIFMPEAWKEVCAGHDPSRVAKVLAERGFLRPGNDGKTSRPVRLPGGTKATRCYVVANDILNDD
ncbi:DUF927 domain-containing protein [Cereibacter sphaeroides]|uniref:DUF927 domain-containing protein n=1 Tax=Cereibacter sphaeroides TaxID=1063 RepID=A0AAX1USG6_CERSP|nr:DUF927 domain-containing protein [Cereibacter sphaeroides]RHZ98855.1 DUF927 domain-containing protein [Cereibacter sphaeroides]